LSNEILNKTDDPVERLLREKKPTSSGKPIAILALLLALAAAAGTGWQWWQAYSGVGEQDTQMLLQQIQSGTQGLTEKVAGFERQLQAAGARVDPADLERLAGQVKTLDERLQTVSGLTGETQASTTAVQNGIRSLEQRLSTVETGLANVAANVQNSSAELDIGEIDFLLRTASERLQLFSDPQAADLALSVADVQLEALNDPMFLSVRQRIATSRRALAEIPRVDKVMLSASLVKAQANVHKLPFRGEAVADKKEEQPVESSWWESLKQTLSSLVSVRRRVPEDKSLLSLKDKDYLRQGLWLQLESAHFALMRNDAAAYTAALERVARTLGQFFDRSASSVNDMSEQIRILQQTDIAPPLPDISAPWTQLQQLRDSRRLLQRVAPATAESEQQ